MFLPLLILSPILVGIFIYLVPFKGFKYLMLLLQSLLLLSGLLLFTSINIYHKGALLHSLSLFKPTLGINLLADEVSTFFLVLTTFLFLCMLIYAYNKTFMNPLFIALILILEGLITAIFLLQDLFSLYAVLEVSTIIVSILIMYKKSATSIYDGIIYLFTNLISMTFFLVGVGYIYRIFGTFDMSQLLPLVSEVTTPRVLILPYVFLMTAVGLKSALMPVFSWLPHAHGSPSAPYIVSALLSALYVKSSLYVFIRLQDIFGTVLNTHTLFMVLGFITALIAIIFALAQKDIKLIFAYSTVSQIGLIVFGLSLSTAYSHYGSIYHIINHAIFKSLLFLCAGLIIDRYHTRDINRIEGLYKSMPFVSIIMLVAILGITGAPLFNGSISKYLIQSGIKNRLPLEYGIMFLNGATMVYCLKFLSMFKGNKQRLKKIPLYQKSVLTILAMLCLIGGIFGHYLVGVFFDITITWTLGDYMEKVIIYVTSGLLAYGFYHQFYKKSALFPKIQELELTFNELVFSIFSLFTGLLTYLMLTVG